MLNKKVLAVAVAAAFSQSALADIDLATVGTDKVIYASELVSGTNGTLAVINNAMILDVASEVGFSINAATTKYVRYDFTDATFGVTITGAMLTHTPVVAGATISATVAAGGQVGDSFVIFEVEAQGGNVAAEDAFNFAVTGGTIALATDTGDFTVSSTATSTVRYALFETAVDAALNNTNVLSEATEDFTELSTGSTGLFTVEDEDTATVDSGFMQFDGMGTAMSTTIATTGYIDTDLLLVSPNIFNAAGTAVTDQQLIDAVAGGAQNVQINGDLSFGTWSLELDDATCALNTNVVPVPSTGLLASLSTANLVLGNWYLCVEVDGSTVIKKSDYSVTLTENNLTDGLGEINYDTTSIEVPYLTTFENVNQKFYIVNNGSADAVYSFTFFTEAAITAANGTAWTGTVPAGEMLMIKATDVVTLTGGTRAAAVIEVEGTEQDIMAATQLVNLVSKGTDTVVLNANSIVSPDSN